MWDQCCRGGYDAKRQNCVCWEWVLGVGVCASDADGIVNFIRGTKSVYDIKNIAVGVLGGEVVVGVLLWGMHEESRCAALYIYSCNEYWLLVLRLKGTALQIYKP